MTADTARTADLAALPIEDLNLTGRTHNCLKREGIHTVADLTALSEPELRGIRNFGPKCLADVKARLADVKARLDAHGLTLAGADLQAALQRLVQAAGPFLPLIPVTDDPAEAELRAAVAAAALPPNDTTTTGTNNG